MTPDQLIDVVDRLDTLLNQCRALVKVAAAAGMLEAAPGTAEQGPPLSYNEVDALARLAVDLIDQAQLAAHSILE